MKMLEHGAEPIKKAIPAGVKLGLTLPCLALLMAGCDLTVPYVTTAPLPEKGSDRIAAAVLDERPEVLDQQKPPAFVGIMRGRLGIPLDRLTRDGRPLADDFGDTIVNSLAAGGYRAAAVAVPPAKDASDALKALKQGVADRFLLLEIRQWRSETYTNTTLTYDVTLHVYDASGRELAAKSDTKEEDTSGGSFFNPIYRSDDIVGQFYARKISEWFSDPAIQAAL